MVNRASSAPTIVGQSASSAAVAKPRARAAGSSAWAENAPIGRAAAAALANALRSFSSITAKVNSGGTASAACFDSNELTPWLGGPRGRSSCHAEEKGGAGKGSHRRLAPCLVRTRAAQFAVAGGPMQDVRSLPRVAERDHAAADYGEGGASALRPVLAPMAECEGARLG